MEPWQFTQNALFVLFSSKILENSQFQMHFSCLIFFFFIFHVDITLWNSQGKKKNAEKCVNVSLNGGLSLRVSPDIDWEPVQSLPHLLLNGSWNTLQPPCDPELDGWMDRQSWTGFCSLKWMPFNCSSFKDFTESAKWSWSGKLFLSLDAADEELCPSYSSGLNEGQLIEYIVF